MSWQPEVDELRKRQELARRMGGEAGIARQRKRGKLTVRERIDALTDPDSFEEFAGLVGSATYEDNELVDFTPKGSVEGFAAVQPTNQIPLEEIGEHVVVKEAIAG